VEIGVADLPENDFNHQARDATSVQEAWAEMFPILI
jgi:hypothetical protein